MQIIFKGRNFELTEALKNYAEEKISKIERYFERIMSIDVEFSVNKNPKISENNIVEVIVATPGPVMKASASAPDMYQAVDMVTDKLERLVKKHKSKLVTRSHGAKRSKKEDAREAGAFETEESAIEITDIKHYSRKPMTPEEAAMQMDVMGYRFFIFLDSETDEVCAVYKKKDGGYGMMEPD